MKELSAAMAKAFGDRHQEGRLMRAVALEMGPQRRQLHGAAPIERLMNLTSFGSTDCWYFIGSRGTGGYGIMPALGENRAHRVAWRVFRGDIPAGLKVLHKCDVPCCVNPDHLFLGTQAENVQDMCAKGRNRTVAQCGERNPMAKLTASKVSEIRAVVAAGTSQLQASRDFGVSPMTVSRIVRGEAWKA